MLPINLEFGVFTPDIAEVATHKYVQKLRHHLEWAYNKARQINEKESLKNKNRYDRNIHCSKLEVRDLVLVRKKAFTGKHKISDCWEVDPYRVLSQPGDGLPVFKVQSCGKDKKERVLH